MFAYGNSDPDADLVLIYGNCQTNYLAMLLAAADPSRSYISVFNHNLPGQEHLMPCSRDFERCVLYLEQYDNKKHIPTRETMRQSLADDCPRLVFPSFLMHCFWPFSSGDFDPRQKYESDFIWGRYPYQDSLAIEVAQSGLTGEAAVSAYMRLFLERMPDTRESLQKDLDRIARYDSASDIQIGDYVVSNFRRKHLFWTYGHMSNEAVAELAMRTYKSMVPLIGGKLETGLENIQNFSKTFKGMGSNQVPIHPQVAADLDLQFCNENTRYYWYGHQWTLNEYTSRYISIDRGWNNNDFETQHSILSELTLPEVSPQEAHSIDMQLRTASDMRWMPGKISISNTEVVVEGWALSIWDAPEILRFLINGEDFHEVQWPLPSPDLRAVFGNIPNAHAGRFRCRHLLKANENLFHDGFMRVNVTGQFGEHRTSYRNAWFVCDPQLESALPPAEGIENATGSHDPAIFQLGGATLVKRIEQLLQERFERPLSSFTSVLDWYCGYGQRTRYLRLLSSAVTGSEADAQALQFCMQTLDRAHFQLSGSTAPLPFPADSFDLVISTCTLPMISDDSRLNWLNELQRIVCPGGLVLLAIPGVAQATLQRSPSSWLESVHRAGILYTGTDPETNQPSARQEHAVSAFQSHDYVRTQWSGNFDVLDIIGAIANSQDLVIMRRR